MPQNQAEKTRNSGAQEDERNEHQFLRGIKDEDLGVYCKLFSARSGVEGQDGGVVTALLVKGFREGLFDAAIVVRRTSGYNAEATVAETIEDVLAAKGTRYLKVNVTRKLRDLISGGKKRIAIVCTPCEVKAARKIQQTTAKNCEITVIGLFCYGAFNPSKLKVKVKARLGVDLDKATKTQVRNGKLTVQADGREYSCNLKDLECAIEKSCLFCDDFTAELADVSVGSVGSKKGYSTVIVRSETGERILRNHGFEKGKVNKQEVSRLAKYKKERAKKSVTMLKGE